MTFTGKWMELKKIILTDLTQTPKDKYGMLLLKVVISH